MDFLSVSRFDLDYEQQHQTQWINFSKFRGSFAQVGNDLPIGITNLADIIQMLVEVSKQTI